MYKFHVVHVLLASSYLDVDGLAELVSVHFRYVDAVLTIPKGTLFPMCGMNLAFDRELIGPAMYFGLMGDGQPIGRYDDMWAGWCVKVYQSLVLFSVINHESMRQRLLHMFIFML